MMEMLALYVGYFLYESDASNWWWTIYWFIIGFKVVEKIIEGYLRAKAKHEKDIEEQLKYWESK